MIPAPKSTAILTKVLFLCLFGLLVSQGVRAQLRLGVIGGIHDARILETNSLPGWDTAVHKFQSSRSGIQLGIIGDMPIGRNGFYFQPSLLYTARGRQYAKNNDSATIRHTDTVYSKSNLTLGYIDLQLNLTYKAPLDRRHKNFIFVSAGPYLSFFYSGSTNSQFLTTTPPADTQYNYSSVTGHLTVGHGQNTYRTMNIGLDGRAGFEFGNVILSYYASRGLTNFYEADYPGSFHHQLQGFSLGLWLGRPAPLPLPKDTDNDGIPDKVDRCPTQPGVARYQGCPVPDTDKDGVDDDHDSCRNIPGLARYHGCPIPDTDHDGIDDEHDSCRTVPGIAKYNGCPIPDSDHDGVNDEEDKCPNQPGVARYQGCPVPDRDGDGINDEEDKCPDEPGTVQNQGCPVIKKEMVEKINYTARNILFTLGSDRLFQSSRVALNELAALLKAHPEWHLTIEGHTDNAGTPQQNLVLSQKRADAVRTWLIRQGIPADRLTAAGYGQERPIADNSTTNGRTANRRVELKVSAEK
jgi:OOP family OmpA-OmpF porin